MAHARIEARPTLLSRGSSATAWLVLVLLTLCAACRRAEEKPGTTETTGGELPAAPPPFTTPPVLPSSPDIPALVEAVKVGVVNITTTQEVRRGPSDPFEFFFGPRGLPDQGGDEVVKRRSLGTGFLVDAVGHVATNAHVVAGASAVRVRLADGREFSADVKGIDERLDVAVLEIEGATDLPFASLGSSEAVRVGEYVVAIGNPFGLGDTVTHGIVSAKGRAIGAGPYDDFLQTDASINPGNSGGPLFNLLGQVVGINTAIASEGKGIGFAIPIDDLKVVLPQLLATGRVERGKLGVVIQPVDAPLAKALELPRPAGALVNEVEPDGPAGKARIAPGDVIVAVDGTSVEEASELPRMIARHKPGSTVKLEVVSRGGGKRAVTVVLDALETKSRASRTPATPSRAPDQGVGVSLVDHPRGGVVVRDVDEGGPAGGLLQRGDVLVEIDGVRVKNARDAAERIRKVSGRPVLLRVRRGGQSRFVAIERP